MWIPSHVIRSMKNRDDPQAVKRLRGHPSPLEYLENAMAFWQSHVVMGILTTASAYVHIQDLLESIITNGFALAKSMEETLINNLRDDMIRDAHPPDVDAVISKRERRSLSDMKTHLAIQKMQDKSKGKSNGDKQYVQLHPSKKGSGKSQIQHLHPRTPTSDRICFYHDARSGAVCKIPSCGNQHLDTSDKIQAARWDRARAAADRNSSTEKKTDPRTPPKKGR